MITLNNLTVRFGGVTALDNISAEFTKNISGIIGPNGAGKTTTMNAISGFLVYEGSIHCESDCINKLNPFKRTRWGLRRSFQKEQVAADLSVYDNILALLDNLPLKRSEKIAEVEKAIESLEIQSIAHKKAADLNTYERRLSDLARCLVGNPKIVMLDEPCGGLQKEETDHLGDLICQIPKFTSAKTLVIDHDVDLISRICEETLVLDFGKRIAFGETVAVLDDPKVKAAYLGIEEAC